MWNKPEQGRTRPTLSDELVNFIRGATRPVLTFTGLYSCVCLQATQGTVPGWLLYFTGGLMGFWLGE